MVYMIDAEIAKFAQAPARFEKIGYSTKQYCDYAFGIFPKNLASGLELGDKTFGLTLMGITHGTEWVGSAVLNELIEFLLRGHFQLQIPLALMFGNPWAAKEKRRFLETDLNRSFASKDRHSKEQKRAAELEQVLAKTAYFLDFHQTTERSAAPFFIFSYWKKSFEFATTISANTPIVTHWGKPFSKDGFCSDEFTNSCGGNGITLELGQNGFDPYQIGAGFQAALRSIEAATDLLTKRPKNQTPNLLQEVYTWADVIEFPEGDVELEPGFYNFAPVSLGQKIGRIDGIDLLSKHDGKVLFPAYPRPERSKKPAELCRIMRPINEHDFPDR